VAYQARLRNLGRFKRARSHGETRRIELEIALASHGHESCRGIARRLGLRSHAYCCRVIRRYRTGQIPSLPPDEQSLLAMRDSLGLSGNQDDRALANPARANIGAALENGAVGTRSAGEPRVMTVDERIAETWREVQEWKRRSIQSGVPMWCSVCPFLASRWRLLRRGRPYWSWGKENRPGPPLSYSNDIPKRWCCQLSKQTVTWTESLRLDSAW